MKIQGIFNIFGHVARGLTSELARLNVVSENISNANQVAGVGDPLYRRKGVDPKGSGKVFQSLLNERRLGLDRTSNAHIRGFHDKDRFVGEQWPEQKIIEYGGEQLIYDPNHPKANAEGYIRTPDINIVNEMMEMITATRSYEANASVLTAAKQLAKKSLDI